MILDLKGNSTDLTHQSLYKGLGEYCCISEKKLYKMSRGSCEKSDQLPRVASDGAEVYKLEYSNLGRV